jgi:hypothetical protein
VGVVAGIGLANDSVPFSRGGNGGSISSSSSKTDFHKSPTRNCFSRSMPCKTAPSTALLEAVVRRICIADERPPLAEDIKCELKMDGGRNRLPQVPNKKLLLKINAL